MDLSKKIAWMDEEPEQIKKDFIEHYKNGGTFQTISGKVNEIEKIDGKNIYIKCKTKDSVYKISRKSLSSAITKLYRRKSLKRNDLADICRYNSALFALLIEILKDKITVEKDKLNKRSWRIFLNGVRFIPSGMTAASAKDWLIMKKAGIKVVMISYAKARNKSNEPGKKFAYTWYLWCIALDMYAIVDSGAFTVARDKNKTICIYEYAEFIKTFKSRICDFVNLDVIGDTEASKKNFKLLKELTGMSPIPVWHPYQEWENSNWSELEDMVKSNDIVAIGGTHKSFFKDDDKHTKKKSLFNRIHSLYPYTQFHYMGGSSRLIFEDIWRIGQADSTGWVQPRANGRIYSFRKDGSSETKPPEISPLEGILFTLENLISAERGYGAFNPSTNIYKWKEKNKNIDTEIRANEFVFKHKIEELRKKFKTEKITDIINDFIGSNQLIFNL